ncbi:hypothetical protein RND71_033657 [Anisodus tanguticus]|uniref:Uncharacterized protein n=1 Tax=Anisodus tanguticus TaxID=243964 RepID=A0AAE1UWC5_9SOLA|nr:hypothetical protein RND71_033657 [Anisodus tanguticus]
MSMKLKVTLGVPFVPVGVASYLRPLASEKHKEKMGRVSNEGLLNTRAYAAAHKIYILSEKRSDNGGSSTEKKVIKKRVKQFKRHQSDRRTLLRDNDGSYCRPSLRLHPYYWICKGGD